MNENEEDGEKKRQPPAPGLEGSRVHALLRRDDRRQRKNESKTRGDLNEAGVVTALPVVNVFRDKDRGASVFTTQSKSLHHANEDQDGRREPSGCFESRQQADG